MLGFLALNKHTCNCAQACVDLRDVHTCVSAKWREGTGASVCLTVPSRLSSCPPSSTSP